MRVLHVVPTYWPAVRYGGPIYSVHGLCKALTARGHDVQVFTTNVDGRDDVDVPLGRPVDVDGVKVWYFPCKGFRRVYRSPLMRRALKSECAGFDVLHLHSVFLWPTLAAARRARQSKVPYLVAPRGMLVKELISRKSTLAKLLWIRLFERSTLEHAAGIHVTMESEGKELRRFHFSLPRLFVVGNGVDVPSASATAAGSPRLSNTILYLGRIHWKKGLDRLITALTSVPDGRLLVAGNDEEGYQPQLERLAADHGVRNRIEFLGPVDGEEKTRLLQTATILALPSLSENFGNVVLEAMSCACPVVVTPEVGLSGVVKDSGAGLVSSGEPEVLGKSIQDFWPIPGLESGWALPVNALSASDSVGVSSPDRWKMSTVRFGGDGEAPAVLDEITPVLLTYNESANVGRTLAKLLWARKIVVVDSFSTDDTRSRLEQVEQVKLFQRRFDTHAAQWNYALRETGIDTEWVLALDADYVLTDALISELRDLEPTSRIGGYRARFKYRVLGKILRGSLYPPTTVLYRACRASYVQDGHTQRVEVEGDTLLLSAEIVHDDRKPFSHWLRAQDRYMDLEAEVIVRKKWGELSPMNRVRKLRVVAPLLILFYCLVVKRGILDGRAGLYYGFQRLVAEALLSLHLLQRDSERT